MVTDDPDSRVRWNAIVQFYTDFVAMPGWSFLSPMIDFTRWVGEQPFADKLFPGTSHASLCVALRPGYNPGQPLFSVGVQESGLLKFDMWSKVGNHRHSDESAIQEAHDVFREFVGWLEVVAGTISADPAWLTPTVVALAKGIDEEKAFDRMPILADALQDAGCDNDEILSHCRDAKQVHVRGCWVVDPVLGKS